jgi:hypothetical protein
MTSPEFQQLSRAADALDRAAEHLERIAAADDRRNERLVEDLAERRRSWAESQDRDAERFAILKVHPVDWLMDGAHGRLASAVARARGHADPTLDDEAFAGWVASALREM